MPAKDTLVLYEPRRTQFLAVALYGGLAAAGGFLVTMGGAAGVLGWVLVVFFGGCVLLSLGGLVKRDSLSLTERGFAMTMAAQRIEYRWDQVRGFYTFERSTLGIRRTVIGVDFAPGAAGVFATDAVRWSDRMTTVQGTSSRVVKGDAGSLQWAYGMEPDDLVNLLERWRRSNTANTADR